MTTPADSQTSTTLVALLREFYTDDDAFKWLTLPQPLFDGSIALDMIAAGRTEELVASLQGMADGVYV